MYSKIYVFIGLNYRTFVNWFPENCYKLFTELFCRSLMKATTPTETQRRMSYWVVTQVSTLTQNYVIEHIFCFDMVSVIPELYW